MDHSQVMKDEMEGEREDERQKDNCEENMAKREEMKREILDGFCIVS